MLAKNGGRLIPLVLLTAGMVLLGDARRSDACMFGRSMRLIPLGTAGKRIVLLQLERNRNPMFRKDRSKPHRWWILGATIRFADLSGKLQKRQIKLPLKQQPNKPLEIPAKTLVKRALIRAKKLKGL